MPVESPVRMMPTRHSPFYSPFLAAHAQGFLKQEGIDSELRLPPAGAGVLSLLKKGEIDVSQSAVSASWGEFDKGEVEAPLHFAQINLRDGFVLVGRRPDANFRWRSLEGKTILADHGKQPFAMLRWAAHSNRVDWSKVHAIDAGAPEAMETAFLKGDGDFVHLQGGVPQQMEAAASGFVIACVGKGLKPLAFSSISALRPFTESAVFMPFVKAFAAAKKWSRESPAREVASVLKPLFPALSEPALVSAIATCQQLGCWEGGASIPREMYDEAQRVFLWAGAVKEAYDYERVCIGVPVDI